MMKKLIQITTTVSSLMLLSVSSYAEEASPRPNILLIMADDLGYADVSFNVPSEIRTPALDTLASAGTIFDSAYAVHPFCGPSRMGMMAGRYPYEFGAPYNLPAYSTGHYREHGIDTKEVLMSTMLQDAGYYTGVMGKWHLGAQPEHHPNVRGFDEFYGFLGGGILYFGPYVANDSGKVWDYKVQPEHNGVSDSSLTKDDYMTDVLTEKGVAFIKSAAKKDQPFFLFMSYNAPHTMLEAKEDDMAQYPELEGDRKIYAGMMHALDRGVDNLVKALKASGEYEDTLIIFLSDNGGRSDQGASNGPLKGDKGDTFEGGYRVPMFFHWPKYVPQGVRYEYPVTALDFYPTFAHLAGVTPPAGKDLDGKSIINQVIAGKDARSGEMIYTLRHRNGFTDIGARQDNWKIVRAGRQWSLYNLNDDMGERNDLSRQHPERLQRMISEVEKMTRNHTEPLWFDNPQGEKTWKESGMPNHKATFTP